MVAFFGGQEVNIEDMKVISAQRDSKSKGIMWCNDFGYKGVPVQVGGDKKRNTTGSARLGGYVLALLLRVRTVCWGMQYQSVGQLRL